MSKVDALPSGLGEAAVEKSGEGFGEGGDAGADARDLIFSDAKPEIDVLFV